MLSKYAISAIRTLVPIAVGFGVNFLARLGFHVNDAAVVAELSSGVPALYYLVIRKAEERFPKFGWLLGYAAKPDYTPTTSAPAPTADASAPAAPTSAPVESPAAVTGVAPANQGA